MNSSIFEDFSNIEQKLVSAYKNYTISEIKALICFYFGEVKGDIK